MSLNKKIMIIISTTFIFICATNIFAIDTRKIFSDSKDSVVLIMSFDRNNQPVSIGSGFFVGNGKTIATNLHVIEGSSIVKIKSTSGRIFEVKKLCGIDESHDLVLLISPMQGKPLNLDIITPSVGDEIVAIGNPKGLERTVSLGIVSGIRNDENSTYYQITSPISPGSSGGPVINNRQKVIGVSTFYVSGGQNLNFAMPAIYIEELLKTPTEKKLSIITGAKREKKKLNSDELVRVVESFIDGYNGSLQASILNYTDSPIRNVRIVAVFYPELDFSEVDLFADDPEPVDLDPVHFMLINVEKLVPSGLAMRFERHDKFIEQHGQISTPNHDKGAWKVKFRILDYDMINSTQTNKLPQFQ